MVIDSSNSFIALTLISKAKAFKTLEKLLTTLAVFLTTLAIGLADFVSISPVPRNVSPNPRSIFPIPFETLYIETVVPTPRIPANIAPKLILFNQFIIGSITPLNAPKASGDEFLSPEIRPAIMNPPITMNSFEGE